MPDPARQNVTLVSAQSEHVTAIASIYNQALITRTATFETKPRTEQQIAAWLDDEVPVQIAVTDGTVAGFSKISTYRDRDCYAGIREYSVYVNKERRRCGVGRALMEALIDKCRKAGVWKLVSRIFPENIASIELARQAGFRVVGIYEKHGQLDGKWKDCVIVELSL